MRKLVGRLIGFVVFLCMFASVLVVVILISTGVLNLRELIPGLPEPPPIDTSGLPLPEESLPEVPEIPQLQAGESVTLSDYVARQPLLARVPAPQQLAKAPQVIGANAFLAILMALIFGATSTVLGNMLREEEHRIQAWLHALGISKLVNWIGRVFRWGTSRGVQRGCLTLPLIVAIIALYGIIFAFLQAGTSIFSRSGVFLAMTMAVSVGLVSFAGDVARRFLGRLWHTRSRFNLYPVNLLVAFATVVASRLLVLHPGIVFGTPGGADMDLPEGSQGARREVVIAFATLALLALIGGAGWVLSGAVLSLLDVPFDARVAQVAAGLLGAGQNLSLAVFLVALETMFFEMIPLAYTDGQTIFKWSKIGWAVLFVPVAFLFNHALLNPQSGFLDSFAESNVRFLWFLLFILVGVTAGLWFYFNVMDDVLQEWFGIKPRPSRPSGGYPPPPPPPGTY
jgi:hypothetical protein